MKTITKRLQNSGNQKIQFKKLTLTFTNSSLIICPRARSLPPAEGGLVFRHTILVILASVPCLRHNPVQDTEDRTVLG